MKKVYKILLTVFTISLFHTSLSTQWVQQPLPVNKPITGIKFINSQTGWACTSRGTPADTGYVIATTNSGTNWFVQISAYNNAFTDINALDNLTCFASAYDAVINRDKIYKTSDGGQNWTIITMVPNMGIDDMQFLNKDSAWECGTSVGPDVRTTTDGGNTWIVRTNGITMATDRIFFLNYNTGFCAATFNLYRTTNAGLNWELKYTSSEGILGLYFSDLNTGWISLAGHKIGKTINGGLNWNIQHPFDPRGEGIFNIYFIGNTGWAGTGWNGKILKSVDGGISWGYQNVPLYSVNLSFPDTSNGWCGQFSMNHSTNGGGEIFYTGFVNTGTETPVKYRLYQNYPNPFNPATTIKLDLPETSYINLVICDILGRELYQIANEYLKAGSYSFSWDASKFASGIYFYRIAIHSDRLKTDKFTVTKKMILIK